jgi:hypothetical protein
MIKISLFNLLGTYAYRMHIQDGGMHAAFDQNKATFTPYRMAFRRGAKKHLSDTEPVQHSEAERSNISPLQ